MADIAHEKDDQEHNGQRYSGGGEDQLSGPGSAVYFMEEKVSEADQGQHIEGE
jgi:hypothetical protein